MAISILKIMLDSFKKFMLKLYIIIFRNNNILVIKLYS